MPPPLSGGVCVAAKGVRALDKAADAVKPMQRGVQNEAKVLKNIGAAKNTAKKTVRLQETREKVTVILDAITDTKFIYNTKQIRGERQAAKKEGKSFVIITGEKTHVSGKIPDTEIIRRKDIGPQ